MFNDKYFILRIDFKDFISSHFIVEKSFLTSFLCSPDERIRALKSCPTVSSALDHSDFSNIVDVSVWSICN